MEKFPSKINPEKSSLVETNLNLVQSEDGLYKETQTGELFAEVKQHPEKQRFIAGFIKGIINSADIISVSGRYYSHVQKHEHVDGVGSEKFKAEIDAETFILSEVFGDEDHRFFTDKTMLEATKKAQDIAKGEHGNLFAYEQNSKKYYFDFGDAFWGSYGKFKLDWFTNDKNREAFKKYILGELSKIEYISKDQEKTFEIIHEKVKEILDTRLNNKDFFTAVMNKSGLDLKKEYSLFTKMEHPDVILFHQLKSRCEIILDVLRELKHSSPQ